MGTNGSGVFRSIDNGDSWASFSKGLPEYFYASSLAVGSSGYVFVAGSSPVGSSGVFRSSDTSDSWAPANNGLSSSGVLAINSNGDIFAGASGGMVFRSQDNGGHWMPVNSNLIKSSVRCITIDATGQILIGTESNWIFRSTDNGATWTALNTAENATVYALAINSNGHIFAGTAPAGAFRSIDNGNRRTRINEGLTNTWVVSLAINSSGRIFAGTFWGGVFRSAQNATSAGEKREEGEILSSFILSQNHPNPFNPSTQISFALPKAQKVTLKVFDLTGKEVATLLRNEYRAAGVHAITFEAQHLPSGIYLYRLQAGEFVETKRMVLIR